MNFTKQKIATTALAISFFGAGATYFSGGFLGTLIHHGFLASLIGGLADWFAVVALFRKPLGISYRTEILKRNKQRIMNEIVNFVVHDILSSKNIMRVLNKEDMAALFLGYLKERGGKSRIMAALDEILTAWLKSVDRKKLTVKLAPYFYDSIFHLLEKDNVANLANVIIERDKDALSVIASFLEDLLNLPEVNETLKAKLKKGIEEYTGDSFGRNALVEFLNLDEDTLLNQINSAMSKKLAEIKSGEGEEYENIRAAFANSLRNFAEDEHLSEKFSSVKKYIKNNLLTEEKIRDIFEKSIDNDSLKESVKNFLGTKLDEFEANEELRQKFDAWLKKFIAGEIEKRQEIIENIVKERLDELSDEKFTDFVEEKVSDDLQMIRVNGGVVGGVVGMILYLLTYAAERMF
ncbi:MAG: DUF445 domain-containing protein [Selenomonadaceae bacterium]|nr:DUF445 domain-containing protein [Selenomonadaceae bacterium]